MLKKARYEIGDMMLFDGSAYVWASAENGLS